MPTPSIQTLVTDAQQVLNLDSISAVRSVVAVALANANTGTPLNPNLTTQQLWNEFYQVVNKPKSDIESIIANQLMKLLYAPPAPGGAGANGQVIFNDNGVLAGDSGLTFNPATDTLRAGLLIVPGNTQLATVGILYVGSLGSPKLKVDVAGTGETTIASATITGDLTAARLNVTGSTIPANGVYLVTTNKLGLSTNSIERLNIDATGNLTNLTTATQNGFVLFNNTIDGGNLGYVGNPRAFITGGATSSLGIRGESSVQFSIAANLGMTLNSTGLGVGVVPSLYRFEVGSGSTDTRALFTSNNAFSIGVKNGANQLGGWIGSAGSNILTFSGNDGTMKVTIDNPGNVGVGVTPSATGGCLQLKSGITFPATQVASSDANTLDDYEEGTFVPNIGGTATYTAQVGRYTKIGDRVYVNMRLTILLVGTGSNFLISGLPFTSAAFSAISPVSVGYFANLATTVNYISGYINDGTSAVTMTGTAAPSTNITNGIGVIGNAADLALSFFYEV